MEQKELIGQSPLFLETLAQARRMAQSDARILITGETGTGKENLAAFIHQNSRRAGKPFMAINCAALPTALMESELFGHVRGAFTGAHRTQDGLISAAADGTLFLDEVAEMELPLQAKLLRFLETGEFRKVGATTTEHSTARIISATHQNLKERVTSGLFREDLYYRLSVLNISLPPLRAREGDAALLTQYFLAVFSACEGKNFSGVDGDTAALLEKHPWPGNIRELQNTIHKAVVLNDGPLLTGAMLADILPPPATENVVTLKTTGAPKPLWQAEKEAIENAINHCRGNIPRAAALLQVSPSTLYRRRDLTP